MYLQHSELFNTSGKMTKYAQRLKTGKAQTGQPMWKSTELKKIISCMGMDINLSQ